MQLKKVFVTVISVAAVVVLCSCNSQQTISTQQTEETEQAIQTEALQTTVSEMTETNSEDNTEVIPFEYEIHNENVEIIKYTGNDSNVIIPYKIEGKCVSAINKNAFTEKIIKSVTFEEGYKSIPAIPDNCNTDILNLPSSLEKFEMHYYDKCVQRLQSLKEINISDNNVYKSIDGVLYSADGKYLICYPRAKKRSAVVPDGVERICTRAFENSCVDSVELPDSLKYIDEKAFFATKKLTSIEFPNGINCISFRAFGASELKQVKINNDLMSINSTAFENTDIKNIYLPSTLKHTDFLDEIISDDLKIYTNYQSDYSYILRYYSDNIVYLENDLDNDETLIDKGIRLLQSDIEQDNKEYIYFIVIELNGDKCPEIIQYDTKENSIKFYSYNNVEERYENFNRQYNLNHVIINMYLKDNNPVFTVKGNDFSINKIDYVGGEFNCNNIYTHVYYKDFFWGDFVQYHIIDNNIYIKDSDELKQMNFDNKNLERDYFNYSIEQAFEDYQLQDTIDIDKLIDDNKSNNNHIIYYDDYSDINIENKVESKQEQITINDYKIDINANLSSIYGNYANEEMFDNLSKMPNLTELHIYGDCYDYDGSSCVVDLTGIEKLKNLKKLEIYGIKIKGTDNLMQLKNLSVLKIDYCDDISFLSDLDSVEFLDVGNCSDKSDDYLEPVYKMKNLKYFVTNVYYMNITENKYNNLIENCPELKIYKYCERDCF